MFLAGEQGHPGFNLQMLRGLLEHNRVQHNVIEVVRDIAGEVLTIMLRFSTVKGSCAYAGSLESYEIGEHHVREVGKAPLRSIPVRDIVLVVVG